MIDLPTLLSLFAPFFLLGALSIVLRRVLSRRRQAGRQVDLEPRSAPARSLSAEHAASNTAAQPAARRVA